MAHRAQIPADLLAGVTLAAVSIPVVLGYAKIAGMPVVTGLYTLLLPLAVFAVLGHRAISSSGATPPPPHARRDPVRARGRGLSGTFVVNGSPTQTQVTDNAGGRSQLASLTAVAVVVIVLLLLTGTLTQLPIAALAAVVFVIAVRIIDRAGMRRILAYSPSEFAAALLTTVAVVVIGVEDGIALAVVVSIINHLRHSYRPLNSVLVKSPAGHWKAVPVRPGARTENGLVIYRFGTRLYYANASRLVDDITVLAGGGPLRWLVRA